LLLSNHSPAISVNIANIKIHSRKKLYFISWDRQNVLIISVSQKNVDGQVDFKTGAECNGLNEYLQYFNILLTANIFRKIFNYI